MPDRLVPNQRQHLREADDDGVRYPQVHNLSQGSTETVGDVKQDTESERGPADDFNGSETARVHFAEREAANDHGDRGDNDHDDEPAVAFEAPADELCEAVQHRPHVPPEVQQDRSKGADMHGDIEGEALIRPAGEGGHQDEMAG